MYKTITVKLLVKEDDIEFLKQEAERRNKQRGGIDCNTKWTFKELINVFSVCGVEKRISELKEEMQIKCHNCGILRDIYTTKCGCGVFSSQKRDIYTEVSNELGIERAVVKSKAILIMYSPNSPENIEGLKQKLLEICK